jgi:type I restriction enzyme S subunit
MNKKNQNWKLISNNFDTLISSENNVDVLKNGFLMLAVMGRFSTQQLHDEPAVLSINRMRLEKERIKNEGKLRASKNLEPIAIDEMPFDIPDGWSWVRLKDIVYLLGDGLHGTPVYTPNGEYFFINGNNLQDGKIVIKDGTKAVSAEEAKKHKKDLNDRTMFVSINGTIGNVAFYNNENIILGKSACYFNLGHEFLKDYLKLVFDSPYFLSYAKKAVSGTTIMNLSLFSMNNFPIPLPPLAEQSRIVQKINEITTICEELKLQIGASNALQRKVADALVEQALA